MEIARLMVKVGADVADVERGLKAVQQQLNSFGTNAAATGMKLGLALTAPLAAVGKMGVDFNSLKEQATVAFTTMLGSGTAATDMLNRLQKFARETPFEFDKLIPASQRLMAMGFSAQQVIPVLQRIGDAVSAVGGNAATLDRVTIAIGQIQAKGRVMSEEMLQLTEAGIPAWQMLADKMGITVPEAMGKVEARAVSASTFMQAFMEGIDKRYGGMMEKQAQTMQGVLSNIRDYTTQILGDVTLPLFTAIRDAMKVAMEGLDQVRLAFTRMSPETKNAALAFLAVLAATGPVVAALGGLATAAAFLLSPLGALAAVSATVAAAWASNFGGARDKLTIIFNNVRTRAQEMGVGLGTVFQTLAAAAATWAGVMTARMAVVVAGYARTAAAAVASATTQAAAWTRTILVAVVSSVASIIAALSPLGLVLAGVAAAAGALALAWANNWGNIQGITGRVLSWIGDRIADFINWLSSLPIIGDKVKEMWTSATGAVQGFVAGIGPAVKVAVDTGKNLIEQFTKGFPDLQKQVEDLMKPKRLGMGDLHVAEQEGEKVGNLFTTGVEDGLGSGQEKVKEKLSEFIIGQIGGILGPALDAGTDIGTSVSDGIVQGLQAMAAKMLSAYTAVVNTLRSAGLSDTADAVEDLARKADEALRTTAYDLMKVGEEAGRKINEAIVETAKGIQQAVSDAERSIARLQEQERIDEEIRQRREVFDTAMELADLEYKRKSEDAEDLYQYQIDIQRAREDAEREMAKAATDEERANIAQRLADQLEEMEIRFKRQQEDLAHRRQLEDAEREYRKQQEKKRADFEAQLRAEELARKIAEINQERDEKIRALNEELAAKRASIEQWQREEEARLKQELVNKLNTLRTEFIDKLPELVKAQRDVLLGYYDEIIARASAAAAIGAAAGSGAASAGGGGGNESGGGYWSGGEYIDPRHQPGGDIFEQWKQNEPEQYREWAEEHGVALQHGGIVTRPTLALIGEAGPEAVVPLSRGVATGNIYVTVNVAGSVVAERDLAASIRDELLRLGRRNLNVGLA